MDLGPRIGDQDKDGGLDMYDGVAQFLACPHSTCATPHRTINQTVETAAADSSSRSGRHGGRRKDLPTFEWAVCAQLPTPLSGHAVAVVDLI